jgi:ribonucleoside-diphosphate reductase alpha chain
MTGVANALEALGFPYGSPGYLEFQSKVEELIAVETYRASSELAGEKGAFPLYDERYLDGRFIKQLPDDVQALIRKNGIRNSHLTSIARPGPSACALTTSAPASSRCLTTSPPVRSNTPGGQELVEVEDYGVANFGVKGRRASEVTAQEHVGVLCVSQKWVDSSVSKTCNMDGSMPWADFKACISRLGRRGQGLYHVQSGR